MKKITLILLLLFWSTEFAFSQIITISYNQGGMYCTGTADLNKGRYILSIPNASCSFSAYFSTPQTGVIQMDVYNPSSPGFIPASYLLYSDGSCVIYAGNMKLYGGWKVVSGEVRFQGKPSRTGHCRDCDCAGFTPKSNHASECTCNHSIERHHIY